ncbi:N-acetylphosphatidylethanolamine-hydrolyzing phospholipase D [Malassezia nana]|uniref:N-acetylphosphatidylethanolamine-hydrolyzing phospholipase D n=1 Tax=Malassezia nana TaxID=180528 RepID=A0AAF0EN96_9BASI|nr:N-acetylphosphatidylethanolamine-hydrolyzing phospholipase D [Malassezia nana]
MSVKEALACIVSRFSEWKKPVYVLGAFIGMYTGWWCLQELRRTWALALRRRRHPLGTRCEAERQGLSWLGYADEQERYHIVARFRPLTFCGRYLDVAPPASRPRWWAGLGSLRCPMTLRRASVPRENVQPLSMEQLWGTTSEDASAKTVAAAPSAGLSYTWLANSTCLLQMHGLTLLTDPMFRPASPFPLSEIVAHGRVDAILLTDVAHLDLSLVRQVPRTTHWIVPRGVRAYLTRRGVDMAQVTELTWWDETTVSFTVPVRDATSVRDAVRRLDVAAVPTSGMSGRTLRSSYVVRCAARGQRTLSFFFCGDSGYHGALWEAIGHMYGPFDAASFPIQSEARGWRRRPMHAREAAQAAHEVGARQSWGRVTATRPAEAARSELPIVPHGETQVVATA